VTKEPEWERVPVKLRRLLQACLQKDPKQRLQAIGDWRLLIEDAPEVAPRRYRWMIAVGGAAVLMAVSVLATSRWLPRTPSPSFQRVTFRRGFIDNGRFANGGKTIAYSAAWDGNPSRVYSTQAEIPESRDLGLANAHLMGVSSSDEMALTLGSGTLARVALAGGAPREIANDIIAADWTSDSKGLAVVRAKPGLRSSVSHRQPFVPDHGWHCQPAHFSQRRSDRILRATVRWRRWLDCHRRHEGKQEDAHGVVARRH
jgi:eukaryotic-like serine/threonine-protein kinase